jgi:shikimate kinase
MNNVILIGLSGVGKTTIGKEIANRLSLSFVDTDELIEQREGKSIQQIFEIFGEDYFRKLERRLLISQKFKNSVVSVGGGMPCFHQNMDRLTQMGRTIYLQISPEKLSERLWLVRKKRPLLKNVKTIEELTCFTSEQLDAREVFYKQAEYTLNINDKASCEITEELYTLLEKLN